MYIKKEELLNMLEQRKSILSKMFNKTVTYEESRGLVEEMDTIDSIIEDINDLNVYSESEVK